MHHDAARRRAALSGRAEASPQAALDGQLELRIVHDDDDVLAAHLEVDFLEAWRGVLIDEPPDRVEPVNDTTFTSSCVDSTVPTSGPPVTRLTTPGGTPASSSTLTKLTADSGVSDDGLNTTVLPQTSAGTIFHDGIAIGKFHGVIIAQTPSGWRTDIANLSRSSDGTVWPYMRRPSPAMKNVMSIASCTSPRVSSSTLPISRVMSRANVSLRSAISCAARNSISARRGAGTSRQSAYARAAAAIARSASSAVDS